MTRPDVKRISRPSGVNEGWLSYPGLLVMFDRRADVELPVGGPQHGEKDLCVGWRRVGWDGHGRRRRRDLILERHVVLPREDHAGEIAH